MRRVRTQLEVEMLPPPGSLTASEVYRSPDVVQRCSLCERSMLKRELMQTPRFTNPVCIDTRACAGLQSEPAVSLAAEQAEDEARAATRDWLDEQGEALDESPL